MSSPSPEERSWTLDIDMEGPGGFHYRWPSRYRVRLDSPSPTLTPEQRLRNAIFGVGEEQPDTPQPPPTLKGLVSRKNAGYLIAAAAALAEPRAYDLGALMDEGDDALDLAHRAGEAFFSPTDTAEVILSQALLRRRRMEEIEERYGLFKSEQVARLSGSEAKNTAQIAHRWQKQGKIFAVPVQGAPRFPGFQFDDHGQPRPVIAEILQSLAMSDNGWAVAIWFDTPHASVPGNKSPAEVLAESPGLAVEAAKATQSRAGAWV